MTSFRCFENEADSMSVGATKKGVRAMGGKP